MFCKESFWSVFFWIYGLFDIKGDFVVYRGVIVWFICFMILYLFLVELVEG